MHLRGWNTANRRTRYGWQGAVTGGALELSNVDIATEFANLIQAQRAFEANARTVTTFDQTTQDTINLKQ
jgi:flagellar hook protein FlgE